MSPSHLALLITAISQSALHHSHFGSAAPPRPEWRLSAHLPALLRANSRRPRSHTALLSAPAWVPEWLHNGTATLVNRTARLVEKTPLQAAAEPTSNIAIDGGDLWSRARGTREELKEVASLASSTAASAPIIPQYFPQRAWLWRQWSGTIVRRVLPREVIWNTAVACSIALFLTMPGPAWTHPAWRMTLASSLSPLEKVWLLASSLVSFVLSFFLSQAYSVWRNVYSSARRVQGRLNDLGLLCAAFATRDAATGSYTSEAEETLRTVARYVRLFNILFYASVTTQFAPLQSPQGLNALIDLGALTADEKAGLLASAQMHNAVLEWLSNLFDTSVGDGRLGVSVSRLQGTSPIALHMALQNKLVELRSTYASIPDQLSGRMPLAYVQLVQILTDLLIFCTPFALVHSVGGFGAVLGTSVVTLFHSSIVSLAKLFLDPFSNEAPLLRDAGIVGINAATLLQETNVGSERWRRGGGWMPEATRPVGRAQQPGEPTASPRHEGHERPASGGNPQPASEALQELQGGVVATAAASGFAAAAAGGGAGDEVAIDGGMGDSGDDGTS